MDGRDHECAMLFTCPSKDTCRKQDEEMQDAEIGAMGLYAASISLEEHM